MDRLTYRHVRRIETWDKKLEQLSLTSDSKRLVDPKGRNVIIFSNEWGISWALDHNKGLVLSALEG